MIIIWYLKCIKRKVKSCHLEIPNVEFLVCILSTFLSMCFPVLFNHVHVLCLFLYPIWYTLILWSFPLVIMKENETFGCIILYSMYHNLNIPFYPFRLFQFFTLIKITRTIFVHKSLYFRFFFFFLDRSRINSEGMNIF